MLATALLLAATAEPALPPPAPETVVAGLVEDLRTAELLLDADALQAHLAHSFTLVREGVRTSGSFAYLERLRRQRERKVQVRELRFDEQRIAVYGESAIASYVIDKRWVDGGRTRSSKGWCTDVFELREDGVWILVHRHRP